MGGRTWLGTVLALACLALAPAAGSSTSLGCSTHQCDSATVPLPSTDEPLAEQIVYVSGNEVVWDSGPETGRWLDYLGNHTYVVSYPPQFAALAAWRDLTTAFWVATTQDDASSNNTAGVGQLAEVVNVSPTSLSVFNATCQEYFLRFEVRAPLAAAIGDSGAGDAQPAVDP